MVSSYYNKFWLEAPHPAGFLSFSCLSYNEGSNWLTMSSLGFHVRKKTVSHPLIAAFDLSRLSLGVRVTQ